MGPSRLYSPGALAKLPKITIAGILRASVSPFVTLWLLAAGSS